ncbi:uncharacterized protein LOC143029685 [Oratosquilla oratoria]|uniref:uncharacterized protein LOC143029685 n=1 Tax=Oratosquilla oratoria TaxID=337810 RepID=UPI003F7734A5
MRVYVLSLLCVAGIYAQPPIVLNELAEPIEDLDISAFVIAYASGGLMEKVVDGYTEDNGRILAYKSFGKSRLYKQTIKGPFHRILPVLDPGELPQPWRKALFINLYNMLTIESLLSLEELPKQIIEVPQFSSRYAYRVGEYTFTLDEIKDGILRGNAPDANGTVMFEDGDPRTAWSLPLDSRIHGALSCGAKGCPALAPFFPDDTYGLLPISVFNRKLNEAVQRFCAEAVVIEEDGSLSINSIFERYESDFTNDKADILQVLSECNPNPRIKLALQEASAGIKNYSFEFDWDLNNVAPPAQTSELVNVHLYMESLCPDTRDFVLEQLHRNWPVLKNMVNLTIIPFGKATATPDGNSISFQCQHGPNECYGNKVQSCVVDMYNVDQQVEFISCMFEYGSAYSGSKCAKRVGLEWEDIRACADGPEGDQLLYNNGVKTQNLRPHLNFVPTVTFEGKYKRHSLRQTLYNFKAEVCKRYSGPEPGC